MNKIGRILIVGGGIGGIQSALDLSSSGYKVYLLDKKLSIGGAMSQLDKTFPTNDCSMCILSPKMVDAGRQLNIELLTNSEVLSVEGEPGNFKVKVLKKARYVSFDNCKGCGDCTEACPVSLPNPYEEMLGTRKAIWRPLEQAVPSAFAVDKLGIPPCRARCPIHLNAYGYVMAAKVKEWERAQEIVRKDRDFVFAATAARICTHPCESECKRCEVDEPVSIRGIKRWIVDWEFEKYGGPNLPIEIAEEKDKRIGIIGAGPAGLTAAFHLRKKGYRVEVFESLPAGGGMLLAGIPAYRLPKDILKKEVEIVEKSGVDIKYNTSIGKDIQFDELLGNFDSVFIATGAHKSRGMKIQGEGLTGVHHAVHILRKINLGEEVKLGKKVVVVGGGNSAMDAARSALRLGSDVTILYRRSRLEMPAIDEEIEAAISEGINIEFLRNPVEFIGENGKLSKVKVIEMELGEPDESGRRRPVPISGSEYELPADDVMLAIGEKPELSFLNSSNIDITDWGTIKADELTLQTSNPKVFAGGDTVTGPASFIDAVAHGMRVAESIDRYISGRDIREGREDELPFKSDLVGDKERAYQKERMHQPIVPVAERIKDFREVELTPNEDDVSEEGKRCIECAHCSECMLCMEACEPDAILHDMISEEVELNVGSIILSPGYEEFAAEKITEFGYGRFPNVVTSIQFERILSASGPYGGNIVRPSDNEHPKKIAWIQCVGSRDKHNEYCSSVCCMYAVKEAVISREHASDTDATIFFMDIRAYGKDFDKYIDRARDEYGVKFVRSRIAKIDENPDTKNLIIRYEANGELKKEEFGLVVLSVGLAQLPDKDDIKEKFGIELNEFGFAKTDTFCPICTTRDGIFVSGAFQSPKDIPETVAQASGAAAMAGGVLSDVRWTATEKKEYVDEKIVKNERPRIGAFICRCGINIGAYVDVPAVVEYAKTLPGVVYAEENLYTCSQDTQEKIKDMIKKHNLNRVVVASCTPRTHEPLFQGTIREAGLNKYLFEMANIRDQDSWVHMHEKDKATEKAKELVKMAVYKSGLLEPLETSIIPVTKRALIIGGGITGMNAALGVANEGFEAVIIEKESELGGVAKNIHYTLDKRDVNTYLKELIEKVENNPKIKVYKSAEIENVEGYVGNFKTVIDKDGESIEIEHGVAIITVGANEYIPTEYHYGEDEKILTQLEFEKNLLDGLSKSPKTIAMIQCVGSRNDEHPWCSRVCCGEAVKNAILTKEKYPDANVFVFYRDIRTYGFKEIYYKKAREMGVIFIRFEEGKEPDVQIKNGNISVEVIDIILNRKLRVEPDYLVLSNGIVPDIESNKKLSEFFKVPINQDGFFLEAHAKLRPVDFATDGVFLAGLAHSPKGIDESIGQAYAAVSRATTVLSKDGIETSGITSSVNEMKCVGCGLCEESCAYGAISLVDKKVFGEMKRIAEVNKVLCKGCGACAAACRSNAIDLLGFTNNEIVSEILAMSEERRYNGQRV